MKKITTILLLALTLIGCNKQQEEKKPEEVNYENIKMADSVTAADEDPDQVVKWVLSNFKNIDIQLH